MMKHLGDITKLNGATIEPVWCVTGGSPCQDLSIAGKRAGLAGARSGLFMEQIRVIKEMREHDKQLGMSGELIRPRYMVWENVPGALSSNKGRDFAAVLEETIRLVEPEAPGIEVPAKGWPTWGGYRDVDGRWSVAWRVHDAQYWGVPQRRRRIALVADFGGDTAHEILFERTGVSGDLEPRGEAGERPAGNAESGVNPAVARSLTARADGSPCIDRGPNIVVAPVAADLYNATLTGDTASTVTARMGRYGDASGPSVLCAGFEATPINLMVATRCKALGRGTGFGVGEPADPAFTIPAAHSHGVLCACFKAGQGAQAGGIGYGEEVSPTRAAVPSGTNQIPAVVLDMTHDAQAILYQPKSAMEENWAESETKNALRAGESKVSHAVLCENVSHALRAKANCAYREDEETYPVQNMVVRRLTPLECERLQGFPDGWTDIGDYTDSTGKKRKTSDSARYKALGNSIALPFWRWMFGRMAAYLPDGATLGSLFDGIGGFPLCWEDVHGTGTAIWASEIEEFPIAVTKKRFCGENMIHYTRRWSDEDHP